MAMNNSPRSDLVYFTLWLFNIAMENDPFTDDFPMKTSIYNGFSIAMLNNLMVVWWVIDDDFLFILVWWVKIELPKKNVLPFIN